ncbi:(2Fe-2S)-binding protein [Caballeronia ptereochthonis]|uniref:NAD(FAD)-dependent dehydrogenase n=1 Tax=Caballeronia ptereochthonis TaxID=1777144 RepID=A0A158CE40_9BURK|nr:(2Fe-2S)-binding protein [Caballeronia ptereochthonis]SAK80638.1 NAD(FAD)-dependent dehydrogenase [Caballeronia ptereochthonis]
MPTLFESLAAVPTRAVRIDIDGAHRHVPPHYTVAAALLEGGAPACRTTPVSGVPRGPFCMMGVCFDCLVEIDGVPNMQACMTRVRDGMRVRVMAGKARLA